MRVMEKEVGPWSSSIATGKEGRGGWRRVATLSPPKWPPPTVKPLAAPAARLGAASGKRGTTSATRNRVQQQLPAARRRNLPPLASGKLLAAYIQNAGLSILPFFLLVINGKSGLTVALKKKLDRTAVRLEPCRAIAMEPGFLVGCGRSSRMRNK